MIAVVMKEILKIPKILKLITMHLKLAKPNI